MEKLNQYRQWVMAILEDHAQFKPSYGGVEIDSGEVGMLDGGNVFTELCKKHQQHS